MTDIPTSPAGGSTTGGPPAGGSPSTATRDRPAAAAATNEMGRTAQVAGGVADEGRAVAHDAAAQASEVIADAREQVASLADEGRQHAMDLLATTTDEVRSQLDDRLATAANEARSLADELQALSEGRAQDAPRLAPMASDLSTRVERWAGRADELGVRGMAEEVADFARRRPLAFLATSVAAGLAVGRLGRAAKEHDGGADGAPRRQGLPDPGHLAAPQPGPTGIGSPPTVVEASPDDLAAGPAGELGSVATAPGSGTIR